jgi:hypothetical protein
LYNTTLVADLGLKAAPFGYESSYSFYWTGYVQDSYGFTGLNPPTFYNANYGANYVMYSAEIITPNSTSCPTGNCMTGLWTGIGGYPTNGIAQPPLI